MLNEKLFGDSEQYEYHLSRAYILGTSKIIDGFLKLSGVRTDEIVFFTTETSKVEPNTAQRDSSWHRDPWTMSVCSTSPTEWVNGQLSIDRCRNNHTDIEGSIVSARPYEVVLSTPDSWHRSTLHPGSTAVMRTFSAAVITPDAAERIISQNCLEPIA
jgi:hypothetical protein